jgi:ribosomal protein S18 acetylase RimI-like enzyme
MALPGARPAADAFPTTDPLPPGLVLRHLRMPDDLPAMNAIANAVRASYGETYFTTDEDFARFYAKPLGSDPATDVAIAEIDGAIAGYGRAAWHDASPELRVYEVISVIDPIRTGTDVFVAVVDALETRLRAIAATHPPGPKAFEASGGDLAPQRDALLTARGYVPVRWYHAMVRPHLDDLPNSPLPEGLEIRDVRPEHLRAIYDAAIEAFRDEWSFREPDADDFQRFLDDPETADAGLWRIAWDGDQVVGQVRSFINAEENAQYGRRRGYTEHIAVRRPWRRRGVARALIAASFPLLRARGMTEAALGVDTQNPSGALHLYESCGFVPVSRTIEYRRPFD